MKKIFANKTYLAIITSDLLSNFGDVLYYMALMNYVLLLPNPSFALSIITISETLPTFSRLLTGYWADRTPNKLSTIQMTMLLRMAIYGILGLIMTFKPALWIVIIAAVFNFFSDLAGQYENGLYIPISLRIISKEDRAEFTGFSQSMGLVSSLLFQSAGALLITVMTFSQLAFINAATFGLSFTVFSLIKPRIRQLFIQKPLEETNNQSTKSLFKDMWLNLTLAFSEMKGISELRDCLIIVPLLNGLGAILTTILTLVMSDNKDFIIISPATSLAIFNTSNIIGALLGGILSMNLLKPLSTFNAMKLATFLMTGCLFGFYCQNIWIVLIFLFPMGIISGAVNPKLQTVIYNSISEDKIATVTAGIVTWFSLGVVATRLFLSTLMPILSVTWISLLLFLLSLALLGYTMSDLIKKKVSLWNS